MELLIAPLILQLRCAQQSETILSIVFVIPCSSVRFSDSSVVRCCWNSGKSYPQMTRMELLIAPLSLRVGQARRAIMIWLTAVAYPRSSASRSVRVHPWLM
jgi:hypothetical protein